MYKKYLYLLHEWKCARERIGCHETMKGVDCEMDREGEGVGWEGVGEAQQVER
jgi:hypothetical protein